MRRLMPGAVVPAAPGTTEWVTRQRSVPVVELGSGPAILLIHSGSGDVSALAAVAALLADRFRTLRYTRPTYRLVPHPTGADAMAAEVADVAAIAAAVDGPLLLAGHSSGAIVAMRAALAQPDRFAGLFLYEPPVALDEPLGGDALRRARAALDAGDPGEAMAIHNREIVGQGRLGVAVLRRIKPVWDRMSAQAAGQVADDESLESLGVGADHYRALDLPVFLLGGARSPGHLRRRLDALAAVLPNLAGVTVMPKQGHMANLRAPGQVAEPLAAFAESLLP
ncbi:MAG TPA: alpha/beta hydrolase [Asanoa sp.]